MSTLRDHLLDLHREHGTITPALVVEAATPTDSPLHKYLEWDDDKAAHKYRLQQAGELIRSVRITYVRDDKPKAARAFVAVRHNDVSPSNYQPVEEALADPVSRMIVLREFERQLRRLRSEYGHLKEFSDLMQQYAQEGKAA